MNENTPLGLDTTYDSDQQKEDEGVWCELSLIPGAQVKVARSGNREHQLAIARLMKPYRHIRAQGRELDPRVSEQIAINAIASALLKDWKGVAWGGQVREFTPENAKHALATFRRFRDEVSLFATNEDLFAKETLEAREGN